MHSRIAIVGAAVLLVPSFALLAGQSATASPASSPRVQAGIAHDGVATTITSTAVGAIRWDGQIGDSATGELAPVGPEEERALGAAKWHARIPFYATVTGTNSISMNGATSSVIDQEIAYAKDAGITYWAFDWYGDETGMQTARELYLASSHHNDINWSAILFTHPISTSDLSTLVTQFQASNYQKVDGDRPLVYAYDYPDLVNPSQIASLRSQTFAAMGVQPYIVALDYSSGSVSSFASNIGADAVSSYVTSGGNDASYASIASSEASNWNSWKATGYQVIPWVTAGWDPQPRIQLSPAYGYASYPSNSQITASTTSELASHLQQAITWDATNATSAPANAVLMYAWNELSEGGYIEPTKAGSGINRDYLDAIKSVTQSSTAGAGAANDTSFITTPGGSTLRNNYGDFVGFQLTTGAGPVTVSELGRRFVAGNTQTHVLKIVKASDKSTVASTVINMAAGSADALGMKYAPLAQDVTLDANTVYYVLSSETSGGDQWYDYAASTVSSAVGTINAAVYRQLDSDNNAVFNTIGSTGSTYGPVNFRYVPNIALGGTATASSQWDASQTAAKGIDGSLTTDWQGANTLPFASQWLQVDFGASKTFDSATISEYLDNRTTGYLIQYWNGSSWVTAYTGTTIGTNKVVHFPAVTGSKARLQFTSGTATPIIFEFQLRNE